MPVPPRGGTHFGYPIVYDDHSCAVQTKFDIKAS